MRTLFSNIPSIDLHGFDRDYAKICIKDFVMDNYKLKKEKVAIIHGIGTGILRKAQNLLKSKLRKIEEKRARLARKSCKY